MTERRSNTLLHFVSAPLPSVDLGSRSLNGQRNQPQINQEWTINSWWISQFQTIPDYISLVLTFIQASDEERDRKYNEKCCRQASCNSSTKSAILRPKERKQLHKDQDQARVLKNGWSRVGERTLKADWLRHRLASILRPHSPDTQGSMFQVEYKSFYPLSDTSPFFISDVAMHIVGCWRGLDIKDIWDIAKLSL